MKKIIFFFIVISFTNYGYIKGNENSNKYSLMLGEYIILDKKGNEITEIISNGSLINSLFIVNPTVEELQRENNNIFLVKRDTIIDSDGVFYTNKLCYKESFIKIFYNDVTNTNDIISAKISNSEIKLIGDVYIGISKMSFVNKTFGKDSIILSKIFKNSNEEGRINQEFFFENENLKEILIRSDYDWIDLEL